ncbi:MAG TPA: nuclear transport factor 2 family protein [Pyrinomonadaceae bacterium]|nr:nuclear transport factor 2 family protein [Pyrinomonadaceae bacterium]
MKKIAIFSILILAFSMSAFGQKTKTDPTKPVREVFDRLVEGIKQADVEKVMSIYNKTEDILFFNNNGSVTRGWETMKKNREATYAKVSNVSLETTGVRIEMLGTNSAYLSCKWKQTQEYDGKLESASGRMTLVFKLINKKWQVIHLHTSPDNPDANRPVFTSERQNQ